MSELVNTRETADATPSRAAAPAAAAGATVASAPEIPALVANAPWVVWPVGRREFYAVIAFALGLPLAWGALIFGWQALGLILVTLAGASVMYTFLKLWMPSSVRLQYSHVAASALAVAALAYPLTPWPYMVAAGIITALLAWLLGGPARGRPPAVLLVAVALSLIVRTPRRWPLLARNALLWGNARHAVKIGRYMWPQRHALHGAAAALMQRPSRALNRLYRTIWRAPHSHFAARQIQLAMVFRLPAPRMLFSGIMPGRVGCAGIALVAAAGLYLAYRHILRASSAVLFMAAVLLGFLIWPLSAAAIAAHSWRLFGGIWSLHAAQAVTLTAYELCSGDFLFAAVFLLSFPGMAPITPVARRWYLLAAGILAAFLQRAAAPVPAATAALLIMQPLAPWLDGLMHRRSWLA